MGRRWRAPTKTFGEGAGKAADLQFWEETARRIVQLSGRDKIIIEKSTLSVRTARAMELILNANEKGIHFEVLSNPEVLAEGTGAQAGGRAGPGGSDRSQGLG